MAYYHFACTNLETGDVPKTVETGSGSGGITTIDWTTYRFPSQLIYRYDPPGLDQEKAESVKVYALWAEKDEVVRATILAALENTLLDVYSSDAYTAKVLWDKLDKTHNTDFQGIEKYFVARFLNFKLVDGKSMTE
ncbi:hypothetical protein AgCh_007188 [Apium graveolens]